MKTKDLMVGDYISVKPSGMLIKVAAIHHKKVAYHATINKLIWVRENLLEPIPLTLEILEKNGWVEDGYFYRHKELGYIQLGKLFEHASFDFTKYGINYRIQTSPRFLQYVHQLQHALRLCGIEKEIVL